MQSWLLLVYKIASEPSARRVYVWRKLKRLGAILLHDAVWVLPANPHTREHLQWLAVEIKEMEGDVTLWETATLIFGQEDSLREQFQQQVNEEYQSILSEMKRENADLAALSRRYQQVAARDYFHSELGQQVRQALIEATGDAP